MATAKRLRLCYRGEEGNVCQATDGGASPSRRHTCSSPPAPTRTRSPLTGGGDDGEELLQGGQQGVGLGLPDAAQQPADLGDLRDVEAQLGLPAALALEVGDAAHQLLAEGEGELSAAGQALREVAQQLAEAGAERRRRPLAHQPQRFDLQQLEELQHRGAAHDEAQPRLDVVEDGGVAVAQLAVAALQEPEDEPAVEEGLELGAVVAAVGLQHLPPHLPLEGVGALQHQPGAEGEHGAALRLAQRRLRRLHHPPHDHPLQRQRVRRAHQPLQDLVHGGRSGRIGRAAEK